MKSDNKKYLHFAIDVVRGHPTAPKKTFYTGVIIALVLFLSFQAYAQIEQKEIDSGKVAVANTDLVPAGEADILIPPTATLEEKVNLLLEEMRKMKKIAMRATIIVTAQAEYGGGLSEHKEIKMTLTGGKLTNPLICKSDMFGTCVFIVEPLSEKDPDYSITLQAKKYVNVDKTFRVEPAAIAMIPIRIELTATEREKRMKPLLPVTR
ncbi:MAG: hypothetical protein AB1742_00980 [bacterium]